MECFTKIYNGWKLLNSSVKEFMFVVWQGSEYASVICYSMFRKIEDTESLRNSVAKYVGNKIRRQKRQKF